MSDERQRLESYRRSLSELGRHVDTLQQQQAALLQSIEQVKSRVNRISTAVSEDISQMQGRETAKEPLPIAPVEEEKVRTAPPKPVAPPRAAVPPEPRRSGLPSKPSIRPSGPVAARPVPPRPAPERKRAESWAAAAESAESDGGWSLEQLFGQRVLPVVGVLVLLAGIIYGVTVLVDSGIVGPVAYSLLGYLFAAGLGLWGRRLFTSVPSFSAVVSSGAVAVAYVNTYSTYAILEIFPVFVAAGILLLLSGLSLWLAEMYKREVIAILGILSTVVLPQFLPDAFDTTIGGLSYAAVLIFVTGTIALNRSWVICSRLVVAAQWYLFIDFMKVHGNGSPVAGLIFSSLFLFMGYYVVLGGSLLRSKGDAEESDGGGVLSPETTLLGVANSLAYILFGWLSISSASEGTQALFFVFTAVFHTALAAYLHIRRQELFSEILSLVAAAALPVAGLLWWGVADSASIITIYGGVLVFVALRQRRSFLAGFGVLMLVASLLRTLGFPQEMGIISHGASASVSNADMRVHLLSLLAVFGTLGYLMRHRRELRRVAGASLYRVGFVAAAVWVINYWLWIELQIVSVRYLPAIPEVAAREVIGALLDAAQVSLAMITALGTLLRLTGVRLFRSSAREMVNTASVFLWVASLFAFVWVQDNLTVDVLWVQSVGSGLYAWRFLLYLIDVGLLVWAMRSLARFNGGRLPSLTAFYEVSFALLVLLLGYQEVPRLLLDAPDGTIGWIRTMYIVMFSFATTTLGLRTSRVYMRWLGLAVLALMMLKIVFFDLTKASTPVRALVFICIGLMILGIGYFYSKKRQADTPTPSADGDSESEKR